MAVCGLRVKSVGGDSHEYDGSHGRGYSNGTVRRRRHSVLSGIVVSFHTVIAAFCSVPPAFRSIPGCVTSTGRRRH